MGNNNETKYVKLERVPNYKCITEKKFNIFFLYSLQFMILLRV